MSIAQEVFEKVVRVGTIPQDHCNASVYIKIENKRGSLSITGVIGPRRSGNAVGGCGQIDMRFAHRDHRQDDKRFRGKLVKPDVFRFAPRWNADMWLDLLDAWAKYHMKVAPPDVIEFLKSLPDTDQTPAWV